MKKNYNIIEPKQFEEFITKKKKIIGKNLLITFDDGFYSNYDLTINFLNNLDIKAIFFVIPDFLFLKDKTQIKQFIAERILLNKNLSISNDMKNMTIDDIKLLVKDGHTIGAHTKSHSYLSSISNNDQLKFEIDYKILAIESEIKAQITHFAYPFGTINSINSDVVNIVRNRYNYLHTGLRGDNNKYLDQFCILRDTISPYDSIELLEAFLCGTADIFYTNKIKTYNNWN